MALNQWFKFYGGEYLSDPKIASLTPTERSCWITLLALSSISSVPGTVEYLTVDALLQKSGVVWDAYNPDEWDKASNVLEKFVRMRMITKSEEGVIEILNWKKRQENLQTAAERQAKYRENKKSNENVTKRVTKVTLDKIREDKNTSEASLSQEKVYEYEDTKKSHTNSKYPHSKEVFSLFRDPQKSWKIDTTQLKHAELLFERGLKNVRDILAFCEKYSGDQYLPSYDNPVSLERNWKKIQAFADRNGL